MRTGEVFAAPVAAAQEQYPAGDTFYVAARLQQMAQGGVVVALAMQRLAEVYLHDRQVRAELFNLPVMPDRLVDVDFQIEEGLPSGGPADSLGRAGGGLGLLPDEGVTGGPPC